MKYIDLSTFSETDKRPEVILGLGNFDGVHLAHRELLCSVEKQVSRLRKEGTDVHPAVWSFEKPSSDYLSKAPVGHLTTLAERLELFREAGMEYAILDNFEEIRDMEASAFIEKLKNEYHCLGVVCGFNFRFGRMGSGTPDMLRSSFDCCLVMPKRNCMGSTVSSSRIRWLIRAGDMELARMVLGRPYSFSAPVVEGKHLGRTLDLPTINQFFEKKKLIPRRGIYATVVDIDGEKKIGVSNIGYRPTVEQKSVINCETHVLDYEGDLYGKNVTVFFYKRLRDEMQFPNVEVLKETILKDVQHAKEYFEAHPV